MKNENRHLPMPSPCLAHPPGGHALGDPWVTHGSPTGYARFGCSWPTGCPRQAHGCPRGVPTGGPTGCPQVVGFLVKFLVTLAVALQVGSARCLAAPLAGLPVAPVSVACCARVAPAPLPASASADAASPLGSNLWFPVIIPYQNNTLHWLQIWTRNLAGSCPSPDLPRNVQNVKQIS